MDASLRFGLGYALHAMAAALEAQVQVTFFAADVENSFLDAAQIGRRER